MVKQTCYFRLIFLGFFAFLDFIFCIIFLRHILVAMRSSKYDLFCLTMEEGIWCCWGDKNFELLRMFADFCSLAKSIMELRKHIFWFTIIVSLIAIDRIFQLVIIAGTIDVWWKFIDLEHRNCNYGYYFNEWSTEQKFSQWQLFIYNKLTLWSYL